MNIAIVTNMTRTRQIFSGDDLERLGSMSNMILNENQVDPDPSALKRLIKDSDIIVTGWGCPRLDNEVLSSAGHLRFIMHAAGSVKGLIDHGFWERGIRISSAAKALGMGVAETALGLTIASLKNMWNLNRNTHSGLWDEGREDVRELYGTVIGIAGAGYAGRHYIKLISNFDVQILLYDPTLTESECSTLGARKAGLEELFEKSDVITLHAPQNPSTYHMVSQDVLKRMKDKAILINTARGSLVDEAALVDLLKTKRITACLDVTDPEPPHQGSELRNLDNCILLPHIAGAVNNGLKRIGRLATEEIEAFITKKPLLYEIKKEKLDIMA
jgi:phosphoglycerate dehydrogenase-like enzyme